MHAGIHGAMRLERVATEHHSPERTRFHAGHPIDVGALCGAYGSSPTRQGRDIRARRMAVVASEAWDHATRSAVERPLAPERKALRRSSLRRMAWRVKVSRALSGVTAPGRSTLVINLSQLMPRSSRRWAPMRRRRSTRERRSVIIASSMALGSEPMRQTDVNGGCTDGMMGLLRLVTQVLF